LVLMAHKAFAFEDVDLVLPIMPVKRCVSSWPNGEMSHSKGRSAHRLVKQPLDRDTFCPLFLNRRVLFRFGVDFIEAHRNPRTDLAAQPA
jgi:hypothetical protein